MASWGTSARTKITAVTAPFAMFLIACGGVTPREGPRPLRVGTSGHDPPFSQFVNGAYVGIDIDLARDLGRTLGRPVVFVPTSWSGLVPDLLDGRFDVAMSGIHITDERRAAGRFSRPYLESGKQAVVRCSDVGRFHTLEDVDRLGVQVLTNIGGTNDAFVRDEFANATVVRDPDKQHLVERLASGEGDVLFADALEATFYVERDPTLCLGLGGELFGNYQVAVFMRRESDLAASIDRWLTERRRQGYVAWMIQAHSAAWRRTAMPGPNSLQVPQVGFYGWTPTI